ncbi:hypothetical protein GQ42DRAFT_163096 [Ramicandelaber brevisporus]|nr:hypothetical protein GQ42DRAFT_163096 [Ramicandelaber brevisporus]
MRVRWQFCLLALLAIVTARVLANTEKVIFRTSAISKERSLLTDELSTTDKHALCHAIQQLGRLNGPSAKLRWRRRYHGTESPLSKIDVFVLDELQPDASYEVRVCYPGSTPMDADLDAGVLDSKKLGLTSKDLFKLLNVSPRDGKHASCNLDEMHFVTINFTEYAVRPKWFDASEAEFVYDVILESVVLGGVPTSTLPMIAYLTVLLLIAIFFVRPRILRAFTSIITTEYTTEYASEHASSLPKHHSKSI